MQIEGNGGRGSRSLPQGYGPLGSGRNGGRVRWRGASHRGRLPLFFLIHVSSQNSNELQLLEAEVQRPPPRSLVYDEFGEEVHAQALPLPASPSIEARSPSPTLASTPTQEVPPARLPPRPYQRLARSSSLLSLGSPTASVQSPKQETDDGAKDVQSPSNSVPSTSPSPLSPNGATPYLPRRRSSASTTSAAS